MAQAEVRVVGFDQLAEGSERLAEEIGERSAREFEAEARHQAEAVRARVPRLSGMLAGSVTSQRDDELVLLGMGGEDVPYAGWIEFGGIREGGRNSWAERPYVPEGRYLYPLALAAEPLLVAAGNRAANREIGDFRWKPPRS